MIHSEEGNSRRYYMGLTTPQNPSDEEFYDAVSDDKSNRSFKDSDQFHKPANDDASDSFGNSVDELNIIEIRKAHFEKFKQREKKLMLANLLDVENDSINQCNFSIHPFHSDEILKTSQRNKNFLQSVSNKQCRDNLYELRCLNNPEESKRVDQLNIDDPNRKNYSNSILRNYIHANTTVNTSSGKYFTYSPSIVSQDPSLVSFKKKFNSKKKNKTLIENENSFIYGTWPSNSTTAEMLRNNETLNSNDLDSFDDTSPITQPTNQKSESTNLHLDNRDINSQSLTRSGKDKSDGNVFNFPTPEEFINPVDKQIAAIFQMSSNSSMQDLSTSDMDNNSLNSPTPGILTKASLKSELVNKSCSENESVDPEKCLKNEFSRSSKKLSNESFNSKSEELSGISRRASFKVKTKEGLRNVFNKFGKAVRNVQSKAEEVLHQDKEVSSESETEDMIMNETKTIKYKASRSNKGSYEFNNVQIVQILHSYQLNSQISLSPSSPMPITPGSAQSINPSMTPNCIIWAMKFSPCGKLLASVGKDQLIRIWVLRAYYESFKGMIKKHDNFNSNEQEEATQNTRNPNKNFPKKDSTTNVGETQTPFYSKPFVTFSGHTSDILDVSWSKNLFILSASSDKTCRLWHIYKFDCLCTFHHSSIVSAISFHPKDDRYFISACLDGKLRLWSIPEKKVVLWNELNSSNKSKNNFITAVSFCQSGKTIAVGTFDGKCILYHTEHLKYYSLINVRSTKGRNSRGSKITGIEVLNNDENKILITSNDSRIRLYDLRDLSLVCKYKGFSNSTVHIKASLSPDDQHIISGSKDKCSYIWKTNYNFSMLNSGRRDRNMYWERIQAHNGIVTCALFAPKPMLVLTNILNSNKKSNSLHLDKNGHKFHLTRKNSKKKGENEFHVFVSAAGCDGVIKIFANKHI